MSLIVVDCVDQSKSRQEEPQDIEVILQKAAAEVAMRRGSMGGVCSPDLPRSPQSTKMRQVVRDAPILCF